MRNKLVPLLIFLCFSTPLKTYAAQSDSYQPTKEEIEAFQSALQSAAVRPQARTKAAAEYGDDFRYQVLTAIADSSAFSKGGRDLLEDSLQPEGIARMFTIHQRKICKLLMSDNVLFVDDAALVALVESGEAAIKAEQAKRYKNIRAAMSEKDREFLDDSMDRMLSKVQSSETRIDTLLGIGSTITKYLMKQNCIADEDKRSEPTSEDGLLKGES